MPEGIFDLEESVQTWAWNSFKQTKSDKSSLKYSDAYMEINWSGVKFVPQKPKYIEGTSQMKSHVIFKSVFNNDSSTAQTHSLKTERETTASCTTSLTKGCTKGVNVGLTLAAPGDVAEASVGFEKGFSIENAEETSDAKTLTWATEGNLTVPPKSSLTAELQVQEKQSSYSFTTSVVIKGKVNVSIYNRLEKIEFVMAITGDIKEVLLDDKNIKGLRKEGNGVKLDIEGKCDFKYGIEQEIKCYPSKK